MKGVKTILVAGTVLAMASNWSMSAKRIYIGDASDKSPLPAASVMNTEGHLLGISGNDGFFDIPDPRPAPLRISYLGYKEKTITGDADSIFLEVSPYTLPEITIDRYKVGVQLICLGTENISIVRGKDSVLMQNKYILQYMLPFGKKPKGFKEMTRPKILASRLSTVTVTDGKRVESKEPDFLFFPFVDMETMTAGRLVYPPALDSLERAAVDVTNKRGIVHHFKRNGDELTKFLDAMEGHDEPLKSPGFMNLLGMSFDINRMNYSHRYVYNPSGTDAALDFRGMALAENFLFKGKLLKKLFKTDEGVPADIVIEIIPLEWTLVTAEESKQLAKHPGNYNIDDYIPKH